MRQKLTILIILSLLVVAGCKNSGSDKSKELELKEKELALKEKELELTKKDPKKDDSEKTAKSEETEKPKTVKKVAPPTDSTVATIVASSVVVRAKPSLTAAKVGSLGKGDKVYVLGVSSNRVVWEGESWTMFNVQLENGKRGWVLEKFVEGYETAPW